MLLLHLWEHVVQYYSVLKIGLYDSFLPIEWARKENLSHFRAVQRENGNAHLMQCLGSYMYMYIKGITGYHSMQ